MFERKDEPLASLPVFRGRVISFLFISLGITSMWLVVGTLGFYYTAELDWFDAFYNSSMMLSTMGPVFIFTTMPAKVFAAFYALTSALVFIATISIALAPIIHRALHMFHLESDI